MTYRWLRDLADAARKSGLRVVEVPGWQHFGRPSYTGAFDPQGITCHHTGSKDVNPHSITDDKAYAEWLAKIGRSDLPAPLCHLSLGRDCTVYVCAAGRGNHAGVAKAFGTLPYGDGNAERIGIEAQNTGSEGWDHPGTTADGEVITQGEGYARLCAALNLHYGWKVANTCGHKETSITGKWDPGAMDMHDFRAHIADLMRNGVDDMPTPQDLWDAPLPEYDEDTKASQVPARVLLAQAHNRAGDARRAANDARKAAERVETAVAAIADALDGIAPGVKKAVRDALADATVQVDVNVAGGDTASA